LIWAFSLRTRPRSTLPYSAKNSFILRGPLARVVKASVATHTENSERANYNTDLHPAARIVAF
jgi:hypothetical protein